MNPVFTHNIWGGTKLREEYGYDVEGDDIGECWGVAAHEMVIVQLKRDLCGTDTCGALERSQRIIWKY